MTSPIPYRPDIDGLRGVAVLLVVLFHLGAPLITGGYIGVDIFFVISGFLITSIILADLHAGSFSLTHFFERRIRRILPALFTVLIATTIAGWLWLFPPDFKYFGETLAATAAFGSNFLFRERSGYFEADVMTVPLLHTWSLAVEEQFYIIMPIVMLATYKWLRRYLSAIIVIGMIGSFALAALVTYLQSYTLLFYYLPTRAWELLMGATLATGLIAAPSRKYGGAFAAALGLGLIIYAAATFDKETIFPGPNALFPTLGAALMIWAGTQNNLVSSTLSTRVPVFFGRISYSLYLWHWPIIVFAAYRLPHAPDGFQNIILFAACVFIAYLSWRFIEQPARRTTMGRRTIFALTLIAVTMFITAGLFIAKKNGFPSRFPDAINKLYTVTIGMDLPNIPNANIGDYHYVLGDTTQKSPPTLLIWGDSHAFAAAPALDQVLKDAHQRAYLLGFHACMPTQKPIAAMDKNCNDVNQKVRAFIAAHPDIKTVILVSHWSMYAIKFAKDYRYGRTDTPDYFHDLLNDIITPLEQSGRNVIFMTEIPPTPVDNTALYAARILYYKQSMPLTGNLNKHTQRQRDVTPALDKLKANHPTFRVFDITPTFCPNGICPMIKDGQSLYWDDNHISTFGAKTYAPLFAPLVK